MAKGIVGARARSTAPECKLACATGEVVAKVGDRFTVDRTEWEIVAFGLERIYYPDARGGAPNVFCKPDIVPGALAQYVETDGTLEWCGDSVAAQMLRAHDQKRRDSRGNLLKQGDGETR